MFFFCFHNNYTVTKLSQAHSNLVVGITWRAQTRGATRQTDDKEAVKSESHGQPNGLHLSDVKQRESRHPHVEPGRMRVDRGQVGSMQEVTH